MNHSIPSKPSIINNNMNLPTPKLSSTLHQLRDVIGVQDIADNSESAAGFSRVDGVGDGVGFFYIHIPIRSAILLPENGICLASLGKNI